MRSAPTRPLTVAFALPSAVSLGSIPGWRLRFLYKNSLDGSLPHEYSTMTKLRELCVAFSRQRLTQIPSADDDRYSPLSVAWRRVRSTPIHTLIRRVRPPPPLPPRGLDSGPA